VAHLSVSAKGGKTRYLPQYPGGHIHDFLDIAGQSDAA
jgi:hypothetical protein